MREKLYYVAKVRPYHGGAWRTEKTNRPVKRTFWQAVTNLDVLSCGALWPVVRATATNQREALRIGKAKVADIIAEDKKVKAMSNSQLLTYTNSDR